MKGKGGKGRWARCPILCAAIRCAIEKKKKRKKSLEEKSEPILARFTQERKKEIEGKGGRVNSAAFFFSLKRIVAGGERGGEKELGVLFPPHSAFRKKETLC